MWGTVIAHQANGEQLKFERWVYWGWIHGIITDPLLTRGLERAVSFTFWPNSYAGRE